MIWRGGGLHEQYRMMIPWSGMLFHLYLSVFAPPPPLPLVMGLVGVDTHSSNVPVPRGFSRVNFSTFEYLQSDHLERQQRYYVMYLSGLVRMHGDRVASATVVQIVLLVPT